MQKLSGIGMKEIARQTNSSVSTVSRALRQHVDVSDDTRKRILDAAKKLRYRPNMLVEALQTGKTRTMGVMVPPYDSYWTEVLYGIHNELTKADHVYINAWCPHLQRGDKYTDHLQEQLHRLIDRRVDGLILWAHLAPLYNESLIEDLEARDLPLVTIDHELPFADCVETDERLGATLAAKHLLELGHRQIAHLGWDSLYEWAFRRRQYFEKVVHENDDATCTTLICKEDGEVEDAAKKLLSANPRPTAIFACSDHVAKMVYSVAQRMKLKIPDDLSVIGYANLEFSEWMSPPLTTIKQNGRKLGKAAARLLIERSSKKTDNDPPARIRIKCELIKRSSTSIAFMD